MIFSINNSFDNERSYSSLTKTLPYYGLYESCANKETIYIYCTTERNDTLTIQYSNSKENTESNYTVIETYNINNEEKKITLTPRLNYFRILLESVDGTYISSYKRIINVYLCESQILLTDTDGNLLTSGSGGVSANVNVVNTPTVSISGTPTVNANISGTPTVSISGTPTVSISGTPTVSISGSQTITFPATNYDSFGRFRVSQPFTLFQSANVNYKNTQFSEYTTGGNTITYNQNASIINLICNASGTVIREGKTLCPYQPGKSLLILNTFVFNSSVTGLTQRVGYYNDRNGIFLELNGTTLNIVKRSYSSGSLVETPVSQANWNTNKLLSGTPTLDITKPQIFWIDIEWLGVGNVRTGFIIDGQYYICHIFRHANDPSGSSTTGTYMTSAILSPRYEITYAGAGSGLGYTLKQICSTVISEGGFEGKSIIRHIGNERSISNINVSGTFIPIIALKLDETGGSIDINGIIIPSQLSVLYDTGNNNGNLLYEILLNPTIGGGAVTYIKYSTKYPADTNSCASYWLNVSGTTYNVSGGSIINTGLLTNGGNIALNSPTDFNIQIGRTYTGNNTYTSDVIVVVVKFLSTGSTPELYAQLGWYEI